MDDFFKPINEFVAFLGLDVAFIGMGVLLVIFYVLMIRKMLKYYESEWNSILKSELIILIIFGAVACIAGRLHYNDYKAWSLLLMLVFTIIFLYGFKGVGEDTHPFFRIIFRVVPIIVCVIISFYKFEMALPLYIAILVLGYLSTSRTKKSYNNYNPDRESSYSSSSGGGGSNNNYRNRNKTSYNPSDEYKRKEEYEERPKRESDSVENQSTESHNYRQCYFMSSLTCTKKDWWNEGEQCPYYRNPNNCSGYL